MARLNSNPADKDQSAFNTTNQVIDSVSISTNPVVITAVQRKANTGNYETIDIYAAVSIPLTDVDVTDTDALKDAIEEAAELGFLITSTQTFSRYKAVKEAVKAATK